MPKKQIGGGGLKLYKTYLFRDKDPIIDVLRTKVADAGVTFAQIERGSGVSSNTLTNWFSRTTKRPQHATVQAVFRSIGYTLVPVKIKQKGKQSAKIISLAAAVKQRRAG